MVNFGINLPIDVDNIILCDSICITTGGSECQMKMKNDSWQKLLNEEDDICFPLDIFMSGDLILVIQDMIRHPTMYNRTTELNGISFGFSTIFGLTINATNVAVIVNGETRCHVELNIWLLFSSMITLSSNTLNPLLRYEYKDIVLNCRKDKNEEHSCDEIIMKTFMLSLKEIASIQVTNLLSESTDSNGILCFHDKIPELELPWNLSENLMSERCICFRPQEVVKVYPEWKCNLFERDMLQCVSVCIPETTEQYVEIETLFGHWPLGIFVKDFKRLQGILKTKGIMTALWQTQLVTGESLTIAVDKYYETVRLYLLIKAQEIDELRHVTMTSPVCKIISTLKLPTV